MRTLKRLSTALVTAALLVALAPASPATAEATETTTGVTVLPAPNDLLSSFGRAIASDGETLAIVSGPRDGSCGVFLYERRPGDPEWYHLDTVYAPGSACPQGLALDGDTLVLGLPDDKAAYLYQRRTGRNRGWYLTTALDPSGAPKRFGWSVAVSGPTVAVGGRGAVSIFARDLGGRDKWGLAARIEPGGDVSEYFGEAVSLSGWTLAVGTHNGFNKTRWNFMPSPGDQTPHGAVPISCGQNRDWEIDPRGDVDYQVFHLSVNSRVEIDIDAAESGSTLDSVLGLFDRRQRQLAVCDDCPAPGEDRSLDSYVAADLDSGKYYSAVTSDADYDFNGGGDAYTTGRYTIHLRCKAAASGVFVYEGDPRQAGSWRQTTRLPVLGDTGAFGDSLALDGSTLVVSDESSAWLYQRRGNRWDLVRELDELKLPSGQATFARFDPQLRGNTLAVAGEEHAVYLFERDAGGRDQWGLVDSLDSGVAGVTSLALGGREIFVGTAADHSGAVRLYHRQPILTDDFESGDLSAWRQAKRKVSVQQPGLDGSRHCLEVTLDGGNGKSFVRTKNPNREPALGMSLRLRIDDIDPGRRRVEMLRLSGGRGVVKLTIEDADAGYRVALRAADNRGKYRLVGHAPIALGEEAQLTVVWWRATGPGHRNGRVRLYNGSALEAMALDLDNDRLKIDDIRLGLPSGSQRVRGLLLLDSVRMDR